VSDDPTARTARPGAGGGHTSGGRRPARTRTPGVRRAVSRALRPMVQWMSGTAAFRRVAPAVVPALDRFVYRASGGRVLMGDQLIPHLLLTTTGAKSGLPRQTPLACLPEPDGSFLVVGSNFGRETHPAWTGNLLAHPEATLGFRGLEIPVTAHLLTGSERADAWVRLLANWPLYDRYTESSGRELRVFRLAPRRSDPQATGPGNVPHDGPR
jgi:deazaflavin-dependent oxidoreductase (nitroreductase family)